MASAASSPRVFISYSHDSDLHKDWVRSLAERLVADGVDIVLDQWEAQPGDDITAFMERELRACDRVLIVCTEPYVKKANALKSGVGYERMIITAQIAKDLGTRKFIPLLRSGEFERLPAFLGARIYVDFRVEPDNPQYEQLLRTLLSAPKHQKPPLGQNPFQKVVKAVSGPAQTKTEKAPAAATSSETATMADAQAWEHHWHRAVHEYFGTKLHLIMVKFAKGSIFLKNSVVADIRASRISDYMIFHLYSHWDVLIRVWADTKSTDELRKRLSKNADIEKYEVLIVDDLRHIPDDNKYQSTEVVQSLVRTTPLSHLRDVQQRGKESEYFKLLDDAGLILEDSIRFHPDRIQFYITINALKSIDETAMKRVVDRIGRLDGILNRSIYQTSGTATEAVLKGQVADYYQIHNFLTAITKELGGNAITETMLVAQRNPEMGTLINIDRAEEHVAESEFEELNLDYAAGSLSERLLLQYRYVSIRSQLHEDQENVLLALIRGKAANNVKIITAALAHIFAPFEERLKKNLTPMLAREYGDWQSAIDEIKKKEGLEAKNVSNFVFGDLCKVYKRVVREKGIIDIAPLTEDLFSAVMDTASEKRNQFSHEATIMASWDEWFQFCAQFLPLHHRLNIYLDSIQRRA